MQEIVTDVQDAPEPVNIARTQLNLVAPTERAFQRIFALAEPHRKAELQEQNEYERQYLDHVLRTTTRDWIPSFTGTMNMRAATARERSESILNAVRDYEVFAPKDTVEQKLIRFEHLLHEVVHPDANKAILQAEKALREEGIDLVIIPGGSGFTGGMIIRDLANSFHLLGQDVDMRVHFDPNNPPNLAQAENIIARAISNVSSTLYPHKAVSFILDSHGLYVPTHPESHAPKVMEEDIPDILASYTWKTTPEGFREIADCFGLTYPSTYGANIRRKTLAALKDLYKIDPQQWERVLTPFISSISLQVSSMMKGKYIDDDESESLHGMAITGIHNRLKQVRRDILVDLFYSTAGNEYTTDEIKSQSVA